MTHNYAISGFNKEKMARAVARSVPVSLKQSIEVCNAIRQKSVNAAKVMLEKAIAQKTPIPYKRFVADTGHRKGMGSGRFPIKTSTEIKKLLEVAEANAQFKGLNTNGLQIIHIRASQSSKAWHYGRQRRRTMKRATIEVVVEETKPKPKKTTKQASEKKTSAKDQAAPKKEATPSVKAQPSQPKDPVKTTAEKQTSSSSTPEKKAEKTETKPNTLKKQEEKTK